MHNGRHVLSWSLQRLGIGVAIVVGLVLFAYVMIVVVVVVGQAVTGLA